MCPDKRRPTIRPAHLRLSEVLLSLSAVLGHINTSRVILEQVQRSIKTETCIII